jgi:hypothetical protein
MRYTVLFSTTVTITQIHTNMESNILFLLFQNIHAVAVMGQSTWRQCYEQDANIKKLATNSGITHGWTNHKESPRFLIPNYPLFLQTILLAVAPTISAGLSRLGVHDVAVDNYALLIGV